MSDRFKNVKRDTIVMSISDTDSRITTNAQEIKLLQQKRNSLIRTLAEFDKEYGGPQPN